MLVGPIITFPCFLKPPSANGTRLSVVVQTARVWFATSACFSREALLLFVRSSYGRRDSRLLCRSQEDRGPAVCVLPSEYVCELLRGAPSRLPSVKVPEPAGARSGLYRPLALHEWKDVGILTVKVWLLLR